MKTATYGVVLFQQIKGEPPKFFAATENRELVAAVQEFFIRHGGPTRRQLEPRFRMLPLKPGVRSG